MHTLAVVHGTADRQLGLITREDLRRCGLSDTQIQHLVEIRAIIRVHRGIYRLPGSHHSKEQRALAACLACGLGAVASQRTAADLWRLLERPSGLIEVTVPLNRRPNHDGIVIHRSRLRRSDVTKLGQVPVTRVVRTIVDLPCQFKEEAFDTAIRDRRITPHVFLDAPEYLGKLAKDRLGLGVPHWKIERKAIGIIRKYRLPDPERQYWVSGYRVDLAYPERKIAIELKGEGPHWGSDRFQYDIDRSNALKLAGWDEYTFTWMQVTKKQAEVAATVEAALGLR